MAQPPKPRIPEPRHLDTYQQVIAILENARKLATDIYLSDDRSRKETRVPSSLERAVFLFTKRLTEFAWAVEANEDENAKNIAIRLIDDALLENYAEVMIEITMLRVDALKAKQAKQAPA